MMQTQKKGVKGETEAAVTHFDSSIDWDYLL